MEPRVVKSHQQLVSYDESDSGYWNELKNELVQKPLEVIDKV